jgi:Xaa-Pro aminopeptidase
MSPENDRETEVAAKLELFRATMRELDLAAVRLARPENVAWLTGGATTSLALMGERGVAELVVTQSEARILTNRIEGERLRREELPRSITVEAFPWQDGGAIERRAAELTGGQAASDIPALPAPLERLRLRLTPGEMERYRALGRDAGLAIAAAARQVQAGMSEVEAGGVLASAVYARDLTPVLVLVAGESRLPWYRHPLPKRAPVGSRVLLVTCARRGGLIASVSRIVSFSPLGSEERDAYDRLLRVEATALDAARPGATLGDLYETFASAYGREGCGNEIDHHHQGGLTGYRTRELRAAPNDATVLQEGMALALNPSVPGLKVEDTILLTANGLETLTLQDWPTVMVSGRERPAILETTA